MANRYPLTEVQFRLLLSTTGWQFDEVPSEVWPQIPYLSRPDDTIAVMASGSTSDPRILNGISAVAGADVLAIETNPVPGEPEGNAYHFVIEKIKHPDFPYLMHGPFKSGTIVPHWYDSDDLDAYFSQ